MTKAYIIGLGRSGIAAAKVLIRRNWEVVVCDRSASPPLQLLQQQLATEGITVRLAYTPDLSIEPPDLIVVSPGVPWDIPLLQKARSQGIDTIGEVELAWRYLPHPWVGITGTNGKTTTTALTAAIFQAGGLNAPACGNIGYAACELIDSDTKLDWIVGEISSYQIETSQELAPHIGIWTTLTPDHLERHKTLENYYQIKASLLRRAHHQILNGDDPYLYQKGITDWRDAHWTSINGTTKLHCPPHKGVYIDDNDIVIAFGEPILSVASFKMVGQHNRQNLLLSVAAARLAGIEASAIARGVATFPGVPHRLEYIRTIKGVDFINDSKATNYDAAAVGLASIISPTILIAGGESKKGDDTGWIDQIKQKAVVVLLIGKAATTFAQRLQQEEYHAYEIVETMDKAVSRGLTLAQELQVSTVLLSPACASFDQYQSFEHRGEDFRQLCLEL